MKSFKALSALNAIFLTALMAHAISCVFNIPFWAADTILLLAAIFIRKPKGVLCMALQVEVWRKDIVENLYADNEFANRAVNGDTFVLAGKVVHIPVAGAGAQVKKNLTEFPQAAVNRGDTEITYALDTYYALPRQIQDIEKYELSYDKRQSVVGEDVKTLTESAMNGLLYNWAPGAAKVIETTGANSAEDMLEDAAGTRKLFTKEEFKKIAKKVSNTNNPGRKTALLTANHYHQFFDSLSDAERTNFNNVANLATGVIGKYMNWEVIMRSSVLTYRKVAGVWTVVDRQADGFNAGADDSAASLFYIDNAVERARGDVKVFDNTNDALYFGDVFSATLRLGGRIRRTNGVYAVVEAIG